MKLLKHLAAILLVTGSLMASQPVENAAPLKVDSLTIQLWSASGGYCCGAAVLAFQGSGFNGVARGTTGGTSWVTGDDSIPFFAGDVLTPNTVLYLNDSGYEYLTINGKTYPWAGEDPGARINIGNLFAEPFTFPILTADSLWSVTVPAKLSPFNDGLFLLTYPDPIDTIHTYKLTIKPGRLTTTWKYSTATNSFVFTEGLFIMNTKGDR